MHHRIRDLRRALGLNQTDFAGKLGLTQTTLSMMENGKSPITDKNVKLICSTFNVNEEWLRSGRGEIFCSSPYIKDFLKIFSCLEPESQQYLLLMARELLVTQQKLLASFQAKDLPESPR